MFTYQKFKKGESKPGQPMNPRLTSLIALCQVLDLSLADLTPCLCPTWPPDGEADETPAHQTAKPCLHLRSHAAQAVLHRVTEAAAVRRAARWWFSRSASGATCTRSPRGRRP
jgi:hypothetical protein